MKLESPWSLIHHWYLKSEGIHYMYLITRLEASASSHVYSTIVDHSMRMERTVLVYGSCIWLSACFRILTPKGPRSPNWASCFFLAVLSRFYVDFLLLIFFCFWPANALFFTDSSDIKFSLIWIIFYTIWSIEFFILKPWILGPLEVKPCQL